MSRRGFLQLYVVPVVVFRVLVGVVLRAGGINVSLPFALVVWALSGVVLLIGLAKRAHDCEHSGAWCLLLLVPIVGWIGVVVLWLEAGTPGPNAAGPAPLELTDARW